MSPALLKGYLVAEAGGRQTGSDVIEGPGWAARFVDGGVVPVGLVRVAVLFVEFEGERELEAAQFLRRKAMRGGG